MNANSRSQYEHLPSRIDQSALVVEVPAFEDDRPAPAPAPPAAAPELVAATQIAEASGGMRTIRRTQVRAALMIAGVPIGVLLVIAAVQIILMP